MALSDIFASSIAGLQSGLAQFDASARTLANAAAWGEGIPSTPSVSVFQEILTEKLASVTRPGTDQTGGVTQTEVVIPITVTAPQLSPVPGPDLVGTMMDMLVAEKLIEANARLISTQSREMAALIDLGK
jgi:flagellar basal body rod protein FlgC